MADLDISLVLTDVAVDNEECDDGLLTPTSGSHIASSTPNNERLTRLKHVESTPA